MTDSIFRERWHEYYSEKRIVHQWFQVHLLEDLPVRTVLEIGPYLGLVTAMLASAGYQVTTLDVEPSSPGVGAAGHVQADLRELDPVLIRGFDCILCCETLEHIHWDKLDQVLARLAAAGAPWLVLSVPYEGLQFGFNLYVNRYLFRRSSSFRKLRFLRRFPRADESAWEPHKWEIGYQGYGLRRFVSKVEAAGFEVRRRDFTAGCRSVFLVCRNRAAPQAADAGAPSRA